MASPEETNVVDISESKKGDGQSVEILKQPNPEFLGKVKRSLDEIESLKEERSSINSSINAQFEMLESYGLNRNAVRAAINYVQLPPERKENFDLSYAVARKAIGAPIQTDLFEAAVEAEVKEKTKH